MNGDVFAAPTRACSPVARPGSQAQLNPEAFEIGFRQRQRRWLFPCSGLKGRGTLPAGKYPLGPRV